MLCCGYTLTDFPISTRLTSLALWQSNDCPSASKATLMNMDKYFMWIHYERLHNHNKAKHNKTLCIFLGIYCTARNCSVQKNKQLLISFSVVSLTSGQLYYCLNARDITLKDMGKMVPNHKLCSQFVGYTACQCSTQVQNYVCRSRSLGSNHTFVHKKSLVGW